MADLLGHTSWTLLFEHEFDYAWLPNEIGDVGTFVTLKKRLKDSCKQMLQSEIGCSPFSLHYKLYKSVIDPEDYLTLPFQHKYIDGCLTSAALVII